jgi:hypothetical protein
MPDETGRLCDREQLAAELFGKRALLIQIELGEIHKRRDLLAGDDPADPARIAFAQRRIGVRAAEDDDREASGFAVEGLSAVPTNCRADPAPTSGFPIARAPRP